MRGLLFSLAVALLIGAVAHLSYVLIAPSFAIENPFTGIEQETTPAGETSYVMVQSAPHVASEEVESALADELKTGPADYRQKDLVDARAFNSTHLEVVRNGVTTAFDKVKTKDKDGKEQDSWKQVAPSAKDADQTKVENLIAALTQTRATSFVDAAPKGVMDKPELTVAIKSNEGKREEKVAFGRSGSDVFAARTGEPGAAKIDASALDGLIKALEEIK